MACLTNTIGDRPIEFYEGITKVWKSLQRPGKYGHLVVLEERNQFPDEWRGEYPERERYLFRYYTSMLFHGAHRGGAAKTTQVGWCNNLTADFVAMLRDTYSNHRDYDFKLIFLKRPSEEIADSLISTCVGYDESDKDLFTKAADDQRKQFSEAWEFGDVELTYQKLCDDPVACLKKINPLYAPNLKAVESIMSKKIRV